MRWNQAKLVLLLLVALALILSACTGNRVESHKSSKFTDRTDVDTYTYEVGETPGAVRLHLKIHVKAGSVAWALTDPTGTLRWKGIIPAGKKMDEERSFEPIAGKWKLEIALARASGNYDVWWITR